jgi:hypothetical protein
MYSLYKRNILKEQKHLVLREPDAELIERAETSIV